MLSRVTVVRSPTAIVWLASFFALAPLVGGADGLARGAVGSAGALSYRELVLADHPVAYYRLDETGGTVAHDSGPHHFDGTIGRRVRVGQPRLIADARRSVEFQGANTSSADDDIRVPGTRAFELRNAISYELWVDPYTVNVRGNNMGDITLLSYGDDLNPDKQHCRWELGLDERGHAFNLQMVIYGHPTEPVNLRHPRALLASTLDRLSGDKRIAREFYGVGGTVGHPASHHLYQLVSTYDGETIRMYVNGALNNELHVHGVIDGYSARDGLSIGGEYADVNPVFYGRIGDVSVYDHVLTPARIRAHYEAGIRGTTISAMHPHASPARRRA
jgi:Concanavalin A-like lectin/glucanases superfamily